MRRCYVCGEHTQLLVDGNPLCLKCDGASPEELKIRKKLKSNLTSPALLTSVTREHDRSQASLVKLLETDLDLGFALLSIAQTEAKANPIHAKAALGRSRSALNDVQRLATAIENTDIAKELNARADALAAALSGFPH
jgi:hypothetical protein